MRRSFLSRITKDQRGAIGPLYAVGILAFVAISAVGFDYGRLMALDTELQNAADQAALAAATQLDGGDDAITRARDAANNTFADATGASPFTNQTRFANDGAGRPITSLSYKFYSGYVDDAPVGTELSDGDGDAAEVVEVTVDARRVFYALTPLVGAFSSGNVIGKAMAGLQSAQCDITPMFFCVPLDGGTTPVKDFPRDSDIGKELKLHLRNNKSETFTPGNFGFLDVPWGTNAQKNRKLGLNTSAAGCFASKPDQDTETGSRTPEAKSLNTRFDIFDSPERKGDCNGVGDFCPSENVTKDWVNVQKVNNSATASCTTNPSGTWERYNATAGTPNPGYPDDSSFTGPLGNGSWSPATWLTTNHPSNSLSDIPDENGNGSISRYEAFLWELTNPNSLLAKRVVRVGANGSGGGNKKNVYCAYPRPTEAPAWPQNDDNKDRRILTVGAVDCSTNPPNGSDDVRILRWVDLFLVRPVNYGSENEYNGEVISGAKRANGDSGFQYFGRKKAVLIR